MMSRREFITLLGGAAEQRERKGRLGGFQVDISQ
jgi:hypothetical protein